MKPWEVIEDRLNMTSVLEAYGFYPNRAGFVCCPFHTEKTPSMKIYDKSVHCFGACSQTWGIANFVAKYFNLSFIDACKKINDDFFLGIEFGKKMSVYDMERIKMEEYTRQIEIKKQERLKRQKEGIFEPSEIGPEWDNILYETITIPAEENITIKNFIEDCKNLGSECKDTFNDEELKCIYSTPTKTIKRFKSELIGTEWFDKKCEEYSRLVDLKMKELNKGEYFYEQDFGIGNKTG